MIDGTTVVQGPRPKTSSSKQPSSRGRYRVRSYRIPEQIGAAANSLRGLDDQTEQFLAMLELPDENAIVEVFPPQSIMITRMERVPKIATRMQDVPTGPLQEQMVPRTIELFVRFIQIIWKVEDSHGDTTTSDSQ